MATSAAVGECSHQFRAWVQRKRSVCTFILLGPSTCLVKVRCTSCTHLTQALLAVTIFCTLYGSRKQLFTILASQPLLESTRKIFSCGFHRLCHKALWDHDFWCTKKFCSWWMRDCGFGLNLLKQASETRAGFFPKHKMKNPWQKINVQWKKLRTVLKRINWLRSSAS